MKDFKLWNKATIAKLVWAISKKKDILWLDGCMEGTLRIGHGGITPQPLTIAGIGKRTTKSKRK